MSFDLTAKIGADGSGYFREMDKVDRSTAALAAKVAARDFEKLDHAGKLKALKEQELALSNRAFERSAAGDTQGASQATLAAMEKREQRERLITSEKQSQAALDAKAADVKGRQLARAVDAEGELKEKLASRADARLTPLEREKSLKADILKLSNDIAAIKPVDAAGREQSARMKIQLLGKQEELERHVTAEKEKQARLDAKAITDANAKKAASVGGRASAGVKDFGDGLASGFGAPLAAGAAAFALVDLTRRTMDYGGEINDLSARLGVSTDSLQELDYAMTLNGATLGDATAAMQKLGIARQEALEKGGDKMDAFKALGISVEQLKTARLEDLFKSVGRSVRDASDVQLVLGDAITVMGKGSGSVMAAMRADLDAAGEEARKLGLIMDQEVIAKLDALGDSTATTGKRMMAGFAPFITFVMEGVNKIMDGFSVFGAIAARWGEMFGKISAGVSFKVAIQEKDAGIEKDLREIGDRAAARSADRPIAPRGEAALGFAGDGTEASSGAAALRSATQIVSLREKIAKMDRDALPLAERRAAIEEDIAKRREALAALEASEDTSQGGASEQKALEMEIAIRDLQKELEGAKEKKEGGKGFESRQNSDSLSRLGLFVGGAPVGVKVEPLSGALHRQEFRNLVQALNSGVASQVAAIDRGTVATKETLS